ncbi:dual OB domain-containing protein [Croceibacterium mercuriale]|uniref:dual OB domain-containing protein n=1 Tax=Croceibacterium mercuriale TaxID=1572751 RepID=UPI00126A3D42|nr:hypothetical protein [Croceibacterium mercuriale]
MNILILGRTRMGTSHRCIGGITEEGNSVRLLTSGGDYWPTSAPFQIGEVWDVSFTHAANLRPPHLEDVLVHGFKFVGPVPSFGTQVSQIVTGLTGSTQHIFDGNLAFTAANNGFINQRRGVPNHSTCFWIPDQDLVLRSDGKHYDYPGKFGPRGFSYVGEPSAIPVIPAGTFVRMSLARWWRPDDADQHLEERCYLQLSGWF